MANEEKPPQSPAPGRPLGGRTSAPAADRVLLRVEDAAELLAVGRTRVYELINSGALRSVKIGGSRRIPTAALRDYVEALIDDRA